MTYNSLLGNYSFFPVYIISLKLEKLQLNMNIKKIEIKFIILQFTLSVFSIRLDAINFEELEDFADKD